MATYYVDGATGSDSNNGSSVSSAWATITHACASVSSGDEVYVKASQEYAETVVIAQSMTSPTRIIGYESVIGDSGKVTIQGGNTRQYNINTNTQANHYWHFENFICEGATDRSIVASGGFHRHWVFNNVIFRKGSGTATRAAAFGNQNSIDNSNFVNCSFEDFTSDGFYAKGPLYFTGCVFRDNGGHGCASDSYTSLTLYRCLITNNTYNGLRCQTGLVIDCTFSGNGYSAVTSTANATGNMRLFTCMIANHTNASYPALDDASAVDCAFFNNHTKNSATSVSSGDVDLSTDPFVDSANNDFSISSSSEVYASVKHLQGEDNRDIGAIQHQNPAITPSSHPLGQ